MPTFLFSFNFTGQCCEAFSIAIAFGIITSVGFVLVRQTDSLDEHTQLRLLHKPCSVFIIITLSSAFLWLPLSAFQANRRLNTVLLTNSGYQTRPAYNWFWIADKTGSGKETRSNIPGVEI